MFFAIGMGGGGAAEFGHALRQLAAKQLLEFQQLTPDYTEFVEEKLQG